MTITGNIVDISHQRIYLGSIEYSLSRASEPGHILHITELGDEDPTQSYLLPGFVDAHIHIESTLLTPAHFAPIAALHGVTSVFADPHEIANVLGKKGVEYMLDNAATVNYNFHFAASPCVPCTTFEHAGGALSSEDIRQLLQRDDIYGLGEMMNIPGLVFGDPEVLAKIEATRQLGKPIDGHMPGASEEWVLRCAEAGITTDHESMTLDEARMKLRHGIRILIREGSAARNFDALSPLLSDDSVADHLMFCSDDKYADELIEGYIDDMVRESIRRGHPLWNVLKAACVNPVLHFGVDDGLLREGDRADFIQVDNLHNFTILAAYVGGIPAGLPACEECSTNDSQRESLPSADNAPNHFLAHTLSPEDLRVEASGNSLRVMQIHDGQLWTDALTRPATVAHGSVVSNTDTDTLKIIVLNRYAEGARPAIGFVSGFGLKQGAMGCSIGHDSHNIIALGTSDEDICEVVNALIQSRGGMSVKYSAHDITTLPLPVAGLMSEKEASVVASTYQHILQAVRNTGCPLQAPFMTLSFLTLPVIPQLKMTDISLFDVEKFNFTSVFAD